MYFNFAWCSSTITCAVHGGRGKWLTLIPCGWIMSADGTWPIFPLVSRISRRNAPWISDFHFIPWSDFCCRAPQQNCPFIFRRNDSESIIFSAPLRYRNTRSISNRYYKILHFHWTEYISARFKMHIFAEIILFQRGMRLIRILFSRTNISWGALPRNFHTLKVHFKNDHRY